MRGLLTVATLLTLTGVTPLLAQSAQGDVSVTIYNGDLALIQDRRDMTLPAGVSRQEFPDVSARIRPETVTISAAGSGIVEQNFDYDLLTPDKLMDKSVGRTITLIRRDPVTGVETEVPATVLANNEGTIVRIGNRIEILERYGARVQFASLPPNLRASPTLSVTLDAAAAGPRPVTLSYLSNGFGWRADYVALYDETAGRIDVQGWITLNNTSGTTFENARVLLVAGEVRAGSATYTALQPANMTPGSEASNRERLGDFYVYPIEGRTTIANAQQKQVSFLDVGGAQATKGYVFRNAWLGHSDQPRSATTVLRFTSSRIGGLGDTLPAGVMRIYMRDSRGQPQFIGENAIAHTPAGSSLEIRTGEAFDVKVQPLLENRERIQSDEWERTARYRVLVDGVETQQIVAERNVEYWRSTVSYKVTNARPTPVTVEVVQDGLSTWWRDLRIVSESIDGVQLNENERRWLVQVPAEGETTLTVQYVSRQ